ncbi:hypothetical protein A3D03_02625 [Candidatus Gottesmanbacteria bacterium RIFCSPHIGHO2_02_FULL_40_13]|uniref:Rod shape-determining protein MreD n=1 Tax=Candidatus Gottesmanbacteria bacterium RIFCSPHIGHO2_02_FULL_40_13 TaxID=1798384 RepID=A0A1F6ABS4_9BACT|nr:MAG: hypothetical protein A3D03_02625 [Candidatus Gottesmanbacteria bacterium RIFCSPHIGHO2_02_FULL_40_13]
MKNKNLFTAILLIVLGVASRTIWHVWPNVELVTSIALISSSFLSRKWTLFVIISVMAISDMLIGNTNIFIFTWSGFLIIGNLGYLSHLSNLRRGERILQATGLGVAASLWFYLWTNFGVWLLDSFGMYPRSLQGLLDAYIYAIPFFKYNLYGNLVLVPVSFTVYYLVKDLAASLLIHQKIRNTN